ncbi:MAG: Uma2 family endonuclease [Isosphaeraceae bacterium]|nr:Uma2 family endonuclease [Isosphaeraceae bacterium]
MSTTELKIGPDDNGRAMSLDDFDRAEAEEGFLYELSRGVIAVVDAPQPRHLAQVDTTREQFSAYRHAHPGRIFRIAGGAECKILIAELNSGRHPDLAIYKSPPPETEDDLWSEWIPEIVIEVVSPSSRHRDYHEKPEEYLRFGVLEYWIIDADKREMLVLKRSRGRWVNYVVRPPDVFQTRLLPGMTFDCGAVFAQAGA